jgi:hypothetical protein
MRGATMLEQENALPGPELHFSVDHRHCLACARQGHADVRWHVVAALRAVSEVISIFRHQAIEEFLEVMSRGWIGVLHDDHAATGVLNKHGHRSIAQAAVVDLRLDVVGDFVHPLATGTNFKLFLLNAHRICGTKITSAETIVAR